MKFKDIIYLLVIAVIVILLLNQCNKTKQYQRDVEKIAEYKDTVMYYKSKSNSLISYNKSLTVSNKALLDMNKELAEELKDLKIKNPITITKIKTITRIDSVYIPYADSIPCDSFSLPFKYEEKWFALDGVVTDKGITIQELMIPNDWSIVVGTKKNGLFKKNKSIVAVTATNPYINTTGIQNYTIQEQPFHNKLWFKGVLFVGGFALGTAAGSQIK